MCSVEFTSEDSSVKNHIVWHGYCCITIMMHADLLIKNGKIRTLDYKNNLFSALAVKGEYILALGNSEDLDYLKGPQTKVMDLEGKTLVPGFIDAHCHLLSLRGKQLLQLDCSPARVRNIKDIIGIIKKKASCTPPGEWILAGSYDFSKLEENRHPDRYDLDQASKHHPIHLRSQSCHSGVINSKAIEISGITHNSTNPVGGEFVRDSQGILTGLCLEEAHFQFVTGMGKKGSYVPTYTLDDEVRAVRLAGKEASSLGITSVGDSLIGPIEIEAYQASLAEGSLNTRVYMNVLDQYYPLLKELGIITGFGNNMLKIGAIKSFADGAIAGHTAWLKEPYLGRSDYYGIRTKSPEEIEKFIREVHKSGFQLEIHANGDRAIEMVLDGFDKAIKEFPGKDFRHRIAHCTVVNKELLNRIKASGVVVLPFSTYVWEHGEKMAPYGERINKMFAYRDFLDYGIPVGGSSDNPCATQDVMTALHSMVNRKSSEGQSVGACQKININEALKIYTSGSAFTSFEEKIKGSLEPGKLADMVILSEDPEEVNPESIREIKVLQTFLGGKTTFQV